MKIASQTGTLSDIKEFLKDHRLDPSANNNRALQLVASNNKVDLVAELLKDERVIQAKTGLEIAISLAANSGHVGVLREFFNHPRIDSNEFLKIVKPIAENSNQQEVINFLLKAEKEIKKTI